MMTTIESGKSVRCGARSVGADVNGAFVAEGFNYDVAFCRNIGIITQAEQQRLRQSRAVVAGLGGMGGFYAETMARLGVGRFTLADGDIFEIANFNRQAGATLSTVGQNKAQVLARRIRDINPEATVRVFSEHLTAENMAEFLGDADLVLDAVEAFEPNVHRSLLHEARMRGVPAIFAAPLGFSAALLAFSPTGMSADAYFDWHDGQDDFERLAHLILGTAPKALHWRDLDLRTVDLAAGQAPSNVGACFLGAGLATVEAVRVLLGRPGARFAPHWLQFDARRLRLKTGTLRFGNRGPLQRLRKAFLLRQWQKAQAEKADRPLLKVNEAPLKPLMAACNEAAQAAGLTRIGFWLRAIVGCALLSPNVFRGREPAALKLKFLPLAAIKRILTARLPRAEAERLSAQIFFAAAHSAIAACFGAVGKNPSIPNLVVAHQHAFKTLGKHQSCRIETTTDKTFRFAITRCRFAKTLAELGLPELAPLMCEADRRFWRETLRNTDIRFDKSEKTIALGGKECLTSFELKAGKKTE